MRRSGDNTNFGIILKILQSTFERRLAQLKQAPQPVAVDDKQSRAARRALMAACNQFKQPTIAVRRFESGNFASDDAVMREYIKALANSNQLSRLSLNLLAQHQQTHRLELDRGRFHP